jgi:hypothetical protein
MAILLVVLVGFAAIGVDFGYRYAARRQAQTAVDTAALGGAVSVFVDNGDLQGAVDAALALADTNTNWTIDLTEWESCTDPDQLEWTATEVPSVSQNTECVSFSAGFDEIRIKLPTEQLKTFFAAVVGVDTLPVSAAAQANLSPPDGQATPPFVVLPPGTAGEQVCLRTSPGAEIPGQWIGNGPSVPPSQPLASEPGFSRDPCDDLPGSSEFFGTLNPFFYEDANPAASPDTACKQILTGIDVGIAEGVDHPLASFEPDYDFNPSRPDLRLDGDGCPQGPAAAWPNTMALQSGLTSQVLKCGFLSLGGGSCASGPSIDGITYDARLKRGFWNSGNAKFAGQTMENRALWTFLAPNLAAANVPQSCRDVQQHESDPDWDYFDKKESLIDCLGAYNENAHDQLFHDDIFTAARFAIIPVVAESDFSSSPVHFNSFVPVFFQTLYQNGNEVGGPDPMCFSQAEGVSGSNGWYRHEAGQGFDCGRSNQNVDRVAAIVLNCAMLSDEKCTPDPGPSPEGTIVYEVRLTR